MTKVRKKEYKGIDVYQAALERTRDLFRRFDKICVSFSGGKDSTAVLNVALDVAHERGDTPIDVVFFDEEAIHPPTIEYVNRIRQRDDVNLYWYCLEFKHRNACSNEEPYWYCWDRYKKDYWVRPMPECAITEHPRFERGMTFQEWGKDIYPRSSKSIAMLTGIRTEESLRRYQVIAKKKNDVYFNSKSEGRTNTFRAFPVYDWSSKDVWLAVTKHGWDYNRTYDYFNKTELHNLFLKQRVCPPFGEEPIRGLHLYAECFPELWHKMIYRVKGAATAYRYANTHLYSNANTKPADLTYQEYIYVILDSFDQESRNALKRQLNMYIKKHFRHTSQEIPEYEHHPLSGISWRFLCGVAIRGDFKSRASSKPVEHAIERRQKLGITEEEAKRLYS